MGAASAAGAATVRATDAEMVRLISSNAFGDWAEFNAWLRTNYDDDDLLNFEFDEDALDLCTQPRAQPVTASHRLP